MLFSKKKFWSRWGWGKPIFLLPRSTERILSQLGEKKKQQQQKPKLFLKNSGQDGEKKNFVVFLRKNSGHNLQEGNSLDNHLHLRLRGVVVSTLIKGLFFFFFLCFWCIFDLLVGWLVCLFVCFNLQEGNSLNNHLHLRLRGVVVSTLINFLSAQRCHLHLTLERLVDDAYVRQKIMVFCVSFVFVCFVLFCFFV